MSEFRPRDIREAQEGNSLEIGSLAAWRWRTQALLSASSGRVIGSHVPYFFNHLYYNTRIVPNGFHEITESAVGFQPAEFRSSVRLYPPPTPGVGRDNAVWIHDLELFRADLDASGRYEEGVKSMIKLAIEATASGRLWTVTLDHPEGIEQESNFSNLVGAVARCSSPEEQTVVINNYRQSLPLGDREERQSLHSAILSTALELISL